MLSSLQPWNKLIHSHNNLLTVSDTHHQQCGANNAHSVAYLNQFVHMTVITNNNLSHTHTHTHTHTHAQEGIR